MLRVIGAITMRLGSVSLADWKGSNRTAVSVMRDGSGILGPGYLGAPRRASSGLSGGQEKAPPDRSGGASFGSVRRDYASSDSSSSSGSPSSSDSPSSSEASSSSDASSSSEASSSSASGASSVSSLRSSSPRSSSPSSCTSGVSSLCARYSPASASVP